MMAGDDGVAWAHGLEAVIGRIAPRFGRTEPRRHARAYLKGLLAPTTPAARAVLPLASTNAPQ